MVSARLNHKPYICHIFIRQVKKQNSKKGKTFLQYSLVQSARENGKLKQKTILYLGSDPLMEDKKRRKSICLLLTAKIFSQTQAFEQQQNQLFKASEDGDKVLKLVDQLYEKF